MQLLHDSTIIKLFTNIHLHKKTDNSNYNNYNYAIIIHTNYTQ